MSTRFDQLLTERHRATTAQNGGDVGRYLIRRILQFIPVFLGATFLIFSLVFLIPGDPIRALSGDRAMPVAVQEQLRDRYNLDDPFMIQYGKYIGVVPDEDDGFNGIIQGNFGQNFRGRAVSDIIGKAFPVTVKLALLAFCFEVVFGILVGVFAGLRPGSFVDNFVKISTIFVISVPIFVIGYVAQYTLGLELKLFPISYKAADGLRGLMMPAMVLGSLSLAYVARLTRTSLIENRRADYVRTARSKGLTATRVVTFHTLRNSLIPVVTFLGFDLGALMSGAIVTETIFNIPGIGREAYNAVLFQEGTVVVGIVTALVMIFMISNLVVDVLYAWLDPRIRYE